MSSETVLRLEWSAILGSGFVASVLLLALIERLRRTFATREELNRLGDKFNALQSLYLQARENTDEVRERAAATRAEQKHQWERIAEQAIRPLERVTEKLEAVGEVQAAQASTLEYIGKRLDRADELERTSHTPSRKRA